jgi:predicted dehydrogenase
LKHSLATVAAASALPSINALGANEKVVIGVMGPGGRGTLLTDKFAQRKDTAITWVCDPDSRKLPRACGVIEKAQGQKPKTSQDFRKMLEDKNVDAIINATPDHWHCLGSILACQTGKDVFVEKPMSHNIFEGRKLVEAARKYKRVVQVGMQSRSCQYLRDAMDYIRSGKLGDILVVRVFNMMQHGMRKKPATESVPVPKEFDYDMWCGPAPMVPYDPSRRWLDRWEFSCGAIAGDAVHQIDLARFLIGDIPYPDTVNHAGGVFSLTDGRDVPDTQLATFEYGKLTMLFESALWTPYMTKTPSDKRDKGLLANWPFNSTRIELLGTKGFMYFGRHGDGWQAFDENAKSVVSLPGYQADKEHHDNFIACIKNRGKPAADAEQGHYSALLCHLANISFRVGNKKLKFDGKTETFPDCADANKFIKRESYRKPWVVPDQV